MKNPAMGRPMVLAAACAISALIGCGGSDGPVLAPVDGTVSYQGKPLAQATVVFAPRTGERVAQAVTDEEGRFRLGTFTASDGAVVGLHDVTIIARGPNRLPPEGTPGRGMPGGPVILGDPLIPSKYFSAATSELSVEVEESRANQCDIELKD